ncbi:MAG: hypothetical protein B0D92_07150 [Spirochaeta sp. LUC14_002_19_P3]|nr:MAG: hypothetical protein B0D92_07150 [Spirochaeta sp. LUC14_002_19_P3]
MNKVKLIFGTHNAIPCGENNETFEEAYQKAFKPFLTTLYNHPNINATLFYSGALLGWLEKHHSEFLTVLNELTSNKTLELLGGAYWEPMLNLIPSADRVGQIELMTTFQRRKFGKRPRGCWISGQVWETQLVSSLRTSGMNYAFLTEKTFPYSSPKAIQQPLIGEDQGKTIILLPVRNILVNQFLKVPPMQILESLRQREFRGGRECVVSLILDGLNLGGGDTNKLCYQEKWLEGFFEAIEESDSWLETVHPWNYLRSAHISRNKIYMSGPNYSALMDWQQLPEEPEGKKPSSDYRELNCREFLSKYRESSLLYAKMMHIVVLANQVLRDKSRKKNAKEELWRGQEHYAYWHGPSGGIYNNKLRYHAYKALLEAEKATRERGIFKAALSSIDFDMDGEKEYLYNGLNFNAYIHTYGAVLFELDYLPVSHNYLATFSQYREDYHLRDGSAPGEDAYPRHAFMDHIMPVLGQDETFRQNSQFPQLYYTPAEVSRDQSSVTFTVQGAVCSQDEDDLRLSKTYSFRRNKLDLHYELTNLTPRSLKFSLGTEINLALSDNPEQRKVYLNTFQQESSPASESGLDEDVSKWFILDDERSTVIQFDLSRPAILRRHSLYMDYRVGQELRHAYQASCFMPCWELELPPLQSQSCDISMQIALLKK